MKVAVTVAAVMVSLVCAIFLWRVGSEAYAEIQADKAKAEYDAAFAYCLEGPIAKNPTVESARMLSCMEGKLERK